MRQHTFSFHQKSPVLGIAPARWAFFTILLLAWPSLSLFAAEEGSLAAQLQARKEAFLQSAPPEKAELYEAGIAEVAASGIYDQAKKVGDSAPDFTLPDPQGKPVRLAELLKKGPVVLTWYRGGWCPYCNLALASLQQTLPELTELGATLVALSPELPTFAEATAAENELTYPVLSDVGNRVAREYGLVFKMTPGVAEAMRRGAKTVERNGDESDELPLSATYVIAPDGTITYAFLDADYRKRAEPSRIVEAVKAIPPADEERP